MTALTNLNHNGKGFIVIADTPRHTVHNDQIQHLGSSAGAGLSMKPANEIRQTNNRHSFSYLKHYGKKCLETATLLLPWVGWGQGYR